MKEKNNISEELLETIERYINGSLTSQELKDFNQLLELDNDFKLKVEAIKSIRIDAQSLKEELNEFQDDISKTIIKKNSNKTKYFDLSKIAAFTAVIIAIASIWFFSTPKNENLYDTYFKKYPALSKIINDTKNFDFYDAMVSYKDGNYKIAIDKWKLQQEKKPENDTLNYFIGLAYLANENIDDAIPFLERSIEAEDDFIFLDEAYQYLGLAYLKAGNKDLAKKNLSISNTEISKKVISELTD